MSVSASWIKPLLEVLESKTSVKVLGAVFVISLVLLSLSRSWKDRIYMTPLVSWLWPWLVVTCAFCGLMLIFTGMDVLWITPARARGIARREVRLAKKEIEEYLENLSRDEIAILSRYAEGNYNSRELSADGVVQGLIDKKILYRTSGTTYGSSYGSADFNITKYAAPYLRKERFQQILVRITKREQEARQASIDAQSSQKP